MTSIIRLNPLSGGGDESPHCYLLEVDGFNFLLDIGWDPKFSDTFIKSLERVVSKIDAVLITYPDIAHLGALPVAVGKLGEKQFKFFDNFNQKICSTTNESYFL